MKLKLIILFLSCWLVNSLSGQEIFLSTLDQRLFSFDLSNCVATPVAEMPLSSTDISFHPNGNLYTITSDGRIHAVDTNTGNSTFIHEFVSSSEFFTSLTISATGIFYAAGLNGDLWRYDLNSDAGIFLGNVGTGAEGDLTFYEGELYMAAEDDNIVRVDIDDPANSIILIDGNVSGNIFGIVSFAESCQELSVYAISNSPNVLYEVNFAENTLDFFCSIPIQVSGGASTFEFLGSNPVFIDTVVGTDFTCLGATGEISIEASGGIGDFMYSIDGEDYQTSLDFSDLPGQSFTIYVADDVGCIRTLDYTPDLDLPRFEQVNVQNATCGEMNGSLQVMLEGGVDPYQLFVNGELADQLTLENLAGGNYQLEIVDAEGCSNNTTANLSATNAPVITSNGVTSTSCGADNGILNFNVSGGVPPYNYTLSNGTTQPTGFFNNLAPGNYGLTLTDQNACVTTASAEILPSSILSISDLSVSPASCEEANGTIDFNVGGAPESTLTYSLNGQTVPTSTPITEIIAGEYEIRVTSNQGCEVSGNVVVAGSPAVTLALVGVQNATCLGEDGTVTLALSAEIEPYNLRQNGRDIIVSDQINNLAAGTYLFELTDGMGCRDSITARVNAGRCPIYFPNAFSPDFDGVNDYFAPQSVAGSGAEITLMQVYDRWGGLVFSAADGLLGDRKFLWDGSKLDELLARGVYVYQVEVKYANGETEAFSGDVLLLR